MYLEIIYPKTSDLFIAMIGGGGAILDGLCR